MINFLPEEEARTYVDDLKYGDTFIYTGNFYMRADSHVLKSQLFHAGVVFPSKGEFLKSLNTKESVLVIKLSTGKLTYFNRDVKVRPCQIKAKVSYDEN